MKIRPYILIVLTVLLAACSKEGVELPSGQRDLIGRRVSFTASVADPFATRSTYQHDGSFNEGDIMTIYRQYSHDNGQTFDATTEAYRVYDLKTKIATGTTIVLETDWLPKKGEQGYDPDRDPEYFVQTEADSLTWDNGKTVRFRAWSRSNLAGAIPNSRSNWHKYYPDYTVAEWVTVSGPTMDIPLELKHLGCRIGFTAKSGNELQWAEICTDWEDYMWKDNANSESNDESSSEHGKTEAQAKEEAYAVKSVYDRMCMPAGVDMNKSLLTAMTNTMFEGMDYFDKIHEKTEADGVVFFDTKTPDEIRDDVKRAEFASSDGRLYMVTIPYDMSTGPRKGEALTLPPFTRFKIWLYDVNDGDRTSIHDQESNYHIFSLADVTNKEGTEFLFPDGMELLSGVSYIFSVGYHYDTFKITPSDNFSWEEEADEDGVGTDETQAESATEYYKWWKDAIAEAIPHEISQSFNPVFHIQTAEEFLEFIKLVNGTAATKTDGLTQVYNEAEHKYEWYRTDNMEAGPVSTDVLEAEGYVFYEHYHPANADQAAYSIEDYLRGPFSFFDEDLNRHFKIVLDNDLDFYDWRLTTIGSTAEHPFRGIFDGGNHTLKNVYMDGGYMFGYGKDVAIRNMKVETVHDFKLLRSSQAQDAKTGYAAYIVGVSIKAPSSGNPIAGTLSGKSYVVGCIYEGNGGALVGTADNLSMYGNMIAATGINSSEGALLGHYASGSQAFLAPQTAKKLSWGNFMVNYYDLTLAEGANAVGANSDGAGKYSISGQYRPQEYIRGASSQILKAKNDNLLSDDVPWDKLVEKSAGYQLMLESYYGLAPWKAMNYAIWKYNLSEVGQVHTCNMHFVNDNVGYINRYPVMMAGAPDSALDATGCKGKYEDLNVLEQNN